MAFNIIFKSSYIKTDINWATLDELKFFVKMAKKNNIRVMNLFMHSYSAMKFDKKYITFKPNNMIVDKLNAFFQFLGLDNTIKVVTMREFYDAYQENPNEFIGSYELPEYVVQANAVYLVNWIIGKITKTISHS